MAGILDAKTRVLDTIITNIGKAQASSGRMNIEYLSFSDAGAIYSLNTLVSGGLDFTSRIKFEAGNLPQDQLVYEVDDSGNLLGNFISNGLQYKVVQGQILVTGSNDIAAAPASGSQFNSLAGQLTSASLNNFKNLYILGSPDPIFEDYNDFLVSPSNVSYTITPTKPIPRTEIQEVSIDNVESLFYDKRLSHIPNFKFLPPVNKALPGSTEKTPIGNYVNVNQNPILEYSDLVPELDNLMANGFKKDIEFVKSSAENNLLCQFFEFDNNQVVKLDVIDFGSFPPDSNGISQHVFFVGKVFTDGDNVTTFVNLFVLVFEQ